MDDWYARLEALEAGALTAVEAAYDAAEPVRFHAASMPLPARVVERLSGDASANVRAAVAGRTDLDEGMLERLSYDSSPLVRRVLARRGDLPRRARARLACDIDADVLDALGLPFRAAAVRAMPGPVSMPAAWRWPWRA